MKSRIALLIAATMGVALGSLFAESDDEVAAHKVALGLAGAFTNDGFKLRDGHWTGKLQPGKSQVVQVNLFAGNQYWFTAGSSPAANTIKVTIYDEAGRVIQTQPFSDEGRAAAGFSPEASGPYYVKVEETQGNPTVFCLLYSYK
jgi:hypothetical protein